MALKHFNIFGLNWEISVIVLSVISRENIRPLLIVVTLCCLIFLWQQRVHKYITFPRLAIFEVPYARHYKPQLVYLPHFSLRFVEQLVLLTIYLKNGHF